MITGKPRYIPEALVDRTLGKYHVREIIGRGGMGVVFRVWDTLEERPKAIKMVPPELASSPLAFEDLKREISVASGIVHTNVVKVLSLEAQDGQYFIVMEFIEGSSLEKKIADAEDRKLKEEDVVRIMKKAAEGIIEAHAKGVIHRDLKPRNIMESGDGEVKILDFGVSHRMTRSMTELTGAETSGTWPYMAPEQLSNNFGRENRQVDIWAFGVTMYQLLTGEVPFRNRDQIVDLKEKPFPMRRVSKKTTHVVLKCLEKDRKKRYQSMSDVLADLEGVKTAEFKIEKITDTVEDDGEDIVRIPRKRFWEWPRFAALVVVVLALLFLYYSMKMNRLPGFDVDAPVPGEKTETRRTYENYFKRAENAVARGDYSAALADLAGAKRIADTPLLAKRTREITVQFQHRQIKTDFQQLTEFVKGPAPREEKIEKTRQFLETYRELTDSGDAAVRSMIVQTRDDLEHLQVRTIPFADLPEEVAGRFHERIRRIEIPGLPQGTRALGRVKIWGYVTAVGTISLQDESIDDTNLEVTGQNAADTIKRMIIRKLAAVSLGPPRDKNGVSVRVKEWEITFKVGTFQDKIILLHEE